MKKTKESSYKDEPTRRFYDFFSDKIEKGETNLKEIASKFGKYESNPGVLFRSLEVGRNGITIELILLAQKHFGLDPCGLFNTSKPYKIIEDEPQHVLNEMPQTYFSFISSQQEVILSQQRMIEKLSEQGNPDGRTGSQ